MASVWFTSYCQLRLQIFNPLALFDSLGGWGGGGRLMFLLLWLPISCAFNAAFLFVLRVGV